MNPYPPPPPGGPPSPYGYGQGHPGPSHGPYGHGPVGAFGPPPGGFVHRPPGFWASAMNRPMLVIRLALVALVLPPLIGFGIWAAIQNAKNQVLVDCGSTPASIELDGKVVFSLAKGQHKVLVVPSGAHALVAKSASGTVLDETKVDLPKSGFRGVFRVGKPQAIVAVSEIYGHAPDSVVKATPVVKKLPTTAFFPITDGTDLDSLDTTFLETIQMGQSEQYRIVWKLCHTDGRGTLGCPNAPEH